VFVGNSVYDIERAIIPQRSNLTKGVLTVMVATSKTRRQLIAAVMAVLRGNAATRKDFTVSTRKDMTIYSHRSSLPVSFDGEVKRLKPPLVYTVRPKSLNVLVVKAKARG
jgi:diacylglycerol kinase family enzyme